MTYAEIHEHLVFPYLIFDQYGHRPASYYVEGRMIETKMLERYGCLQVDKLFLAKDNPDDDRPYLALSLNFGELWQIPR